jgi:hypothetical protein
MIGVQRASHPYRIVLKSIRSREALMNMDKTIYAMRLMRAERAMPVKQ